MTGDSATFADALHFGRFSTAWLWIGPSLDRRTTKSKVMAFLWCNSLLLNMLNTFLCKIMKRNWNVSLNHVLPSDRTLGILKIGPLYHCHTQLNVCEKEELQCFLYLIQIFGCYWSLEQCNILAHAVRKMYNLLQFNPNGRHIKETSP